MLSAHDHIRGVDNLVLVMADTHDRCSSLQTLALLPTRETCSYPMEMVHFLICAAFVHSMQYHQCVVGAHPFVSGPVARTTSVSTHVAVYPLVRICCRSANT